MSISRTTRSQSVKSSLRQFIQLLGINFVILGCLGLTLTIMTLFTENSDPWAPYAFGFSLILLGLGARLAPLRKSWQGR